MFKIIAHSVMACLSVSKDYRHLHRLDCRCLEDIGLDPKDLLSSKYSVYFHIAHHPSWDCGEHSRKCLSHGSNIQIK